MIPISIFNCINDWLAQKALQDYHILLLLNDLIRIFFHVMIKALIAILAWLLYCLSWMGIWQWHHDNSSGIYRQQFHLSIFSKEYSFFVPKGAFCTDSSVLFRDFIELFWFLLLWNYFLQKSSFSFTYVLFFFDTWSTLSIKEL